MEEDVQILEPNDINPCDWLLNRLPRLPIFANYYPQISNTLRFACQAENDPVVSIANRLRHLGTITFLRNCIRFVSFFVLGGFHVHAVFGTLCSR